MTALNQFNGPRVGGVGRVDAVTTRHRRDSRRSPRGGVSCALRPRSAAIAAAALALSACAATQDPAAVAPSGPGFLLGLWHGFIFPIAWIVSLFTDKVAIYAVPNNGGWYDFGYFVGIVFIGVGARKSKVIYKDRVIDVKAKRVEEVGP